jgi:hypothetical protein
VPAGTSKRQLPSGKIATYFVVALELTGVVRAGVGAGCGGGAAAAPKRGDAMEALLPVRPHAVRAGCHVACGKGVLVTDAVRRMTRVHGIGQPPFDIFELSVRRDSELMTRRWQLSAHCAPV